MKRRKKNIAVTGANGYLGSFISDFLKKKYNIYKRESDRESKTD